MNANAKKWVKALESGKYKQCRGTLRKPSTNGHCCLGVACELYIKSGGVLSKQETSENETSYGGNRSLLPEEVREWVGLRSEDGTYLIKQSLSAKNDRGASFKQIAAIIRSEPEGLFAQTIHHNT